MGKYTILILLVFVGYSCKKKEKAIISETAIAEAFSIQDFPKLIEIEPDVLPLLSNWTEFLALENSMSVLQRATNTEDLKLAINDMVEKEKALEASSYPDPFNALQIKSRQRLFKTFLLQVQANLKDNREINEPMKQMITAYNAYKKQFTSMATNTLDAKLILNEE